MLKLTLKESQETIEAQSAHRRQAEFPPCYDYSYDYNDVQHDSASGC